MPVPFHQLAEYFRHVRQPGVNKSGYSAAGFEYLPSRLPPETVERLKKFQFGGLEFLALEPLVITRPVNPKDPFADQEGFLTDDILNLDREDGTPLFLMQYNNKKEIAAGRLLFVAGITLSHYKGEAIDIAVEFYRSANPALIEGSKGDNPNLEAFGAHILSGQLDFSAIDGRFVAYRDRGFLGASPDKQYLQEMFYLSGKPLQIFKVQEFPDPPKKAPGPERRRGWIRGE